MSEKSSFLTCLCHQCSHRMDWQADMVGTETQCPACRRTTFFACPEFAGLIQLQAEKPREFAEFAKSFGVEDDLKGDAITSRSWRMQLAGKIICTIRAKWEESRQLGWIRRQTFPDYFEAQCGCRPSSHGYSCANTYATYVLAPRGTPRKILEADYDNNSAQALEQASRIVSRVKDDLDHIAVTKAALILRQRSLFANKELRTLFGRLQNDQCTGQMILVENPESAALDAQPFGYAEALDVASRIVKAGHASLIAGALGKEAALTRDLQTARSLAIAAANIRCGLMRNIDEHGQRRFADANITAWMALHDPLRIVTAETMKSDYVAAVKQMEDMEDLLFEAGIAPPELPPLPRSEDQGSLSITAYQEISLKRWRGAEQQVLELLRKKQWQVADVSRRNLGYDIEARTPEGEPAFIEVKSIEHPGQPFTLTTNEEAVAREKGPAYRLAVVRQTSAQLEVALISDPVRVLKLTRQCRQWVWECAEYEYQPTHYQLE